MSRIRLLTSLLLFCACSAFARDGYVVRVDSDTVYLDITESSAAAHPGADFAIYIESDTLTNPVTGEMLGKTHFIAAEGTVSSVEPKYAVGSLKMHSGDVLPGQYFKWRAASPAKAMLKAAWQSAGLDFAATGMALGSFTAPGAGEIALATREEVGIYTVDADDALSKIMAYRPGGFYRILSIDAADLNGTGRDSVFVSVYDSSTRSFQTLVLAAAEKLSRTDTLGWLTRAVALADGGRRLYGQQLFYSGALRRSQVRAVSYSSGTYVLDGAALPLPEPASVYGLAMLPGIVGKADTLVYVSDSGRLRLRGAQKSQDEIPGDYDAANDTLLLEDGVSLRIEPRLAARYADGGAAIFAAAVPDRQLRSGFASGPGDTLLVRLSGSGGLLEPQGEAALDGRGCDIDYGSVGRAGQGVAVCVVGHDGKTVVKLFK